MGAGADGPAGRAASRRTALFTTIIDEAELRREIGGPGVLADQLTHLPACAELPHVDIRVLPANVGAHPSSGSFVVFTTAEPDLEVGYAETLGGAVYIEPPNSERFIRVYDRLLNITLEPAGSAKLAWRVGTCSTKAGGNCLEAGAVAGRVAVRHSHHPDGLALVFDRGSWAAFVGGVKNDESTF